MYTEKPSADSADPKPEHVNMLLTMVDQMLNISKIMLHDSIMGRDITNKSLRVATMQANSRLLI